MSFSHYDAGVDIAAVWETAAGSNTPGTWFLSAQPLNAEQDRTLVTISMLAQAGAKLHRAWWVGALAAAADPTQLGVQIVKRNGTPSATSAWLVPRIIAIIVSVVAFLVASSACVRERELGTLPLLAIAPGVGWCRMFLGKLVLPTLVGVVQLALLLLFAAALYRFGIKPGLLGLFAVEALAVLAVAFQGLLVSALVQTQFHAYLVAAMYLVALLLLTGFIFPTNEGSAAVQAIAQLFPLTFAMPPLSAWLTFGVLPGRFASEVLGLLFQTLVFGVLASLALWRLRRQL